MCQHRCCWTSITPCFSVYISIIILHLPPNHVHAESGCACMRLSLLSLVMNICNRKSVLPVHSPNALHIHRILPLSIKNIFFMFQFSLYMEYITSLSVPFAFCVDHYYFRKLFVVHSFVHCGRPTGSSCIRLVNLCLFLFQKWKLRRKCERLLGRFHPDGHHRTCTFM